MPLTTGIIKKCIEEASKSSYTVKLGSIIFKGTRILGSGHNEIRSCSAINPKYKKWYNSQHSEIDCILSIKDWKTIKGASILTIKISKANKSLSNAKPCEFCYKTLLFLGIKYIYYSDENGGISCINVTKENKEELNKDTGKFTLQNKRFGKLNAIEYIKSGKEKKKWKCICDCGNIVYISRYDLLHGAIKSCGNCGNFKKGAY